MVRISIARRVLVDQPRSNCALGISNSRTNEKDLISKGNHRSKGSPLSRRLSEGTSELGARALVIIRARSPWRRQAWPAHHLSLHCFNRLCAPSPAECWASTASRSSRTRCGSSFRAMFAMSCTPSSVPCGSASRGASRALSCHQWSSSAPSPLSGATSFSAFSAFSVRG